MRKASFLAAFMFMSAVTFAQTYKLSVTKNNGNKVVIPTEQISKIDFIEEDFPFDRSAEPPVVRPAHNDPRPQYFVFQI